jgi:hypothetical protein
MTWIWIWIRGSMPLWLMDPDADLDNAIFILDLQDANKKLIVSHRTNCSLLN